jgi:hypothetical protein
VLFDARRQRRHPLLMPRLGEAVEPSHGLALEPWWRPVDRGGRVDVRPAEPGELPGTAKSMPWPVD